MGVARNYTIQFIAILVCLCVFLSCKSGDPEKDAIQRIVAKYNMAIITAYKELNMGPLQDIALEGHVNKVKTIINSYLEANQIMIADILKLNIKEIRIEGEKATARTSEDWKYKWIDNKTGKDVEPLKEIHYEMVYKMVKKDAKWMVEAVEEVTEGSAAKGGS